jgi:hypothetical protein
MKDISHKVAMLIRNGDIRPSMMQAVNHKSAYEHEQAGNCQELWLAVVERAFRDAIWIPTELIDNLAELSRARIDAIVWLRGATHGFFQVCRNAGLDPGYVIGMAKRRLGGELNKTQNSRTLKSLRAEAICRAACAKL